MQTLRPLSRLGVSESEICKTPWVLPPGHWCMLQIRDSKPQCSGRPDSLHDEVSQLFMCAHDNRFALTLGLLSAGRWGCVDTEIISFMERGRLAHRARWQ